MGLLNSVRCSYGALRALSGLTKLVNPFCRRFDRAENCAARTSAALPQGSINGQGLAPFAALPYGAWNVGNNGCEVIAVYNALLALRRPRPLAEIAAALEKDGLLFNGFGGTNVSAVERYLRRCGIDVTVLRRAERAQYDEAVQSAGCAVLAYWTGPTLRRPDGEWNMLHTVSVQRCDGGVEVCNVVPDRPAPYRAASVTEFLRRVSGEPVCLFALKAVDKREEIAY